MRCLKGPPDQIALLLLLSLSVVLHLELLPYAFDDAYIHIRVAERLLVEGVPYYNSGQPVMASSSPGWTLMLAALFAVLGTELWPIAALNAFLSVLGALLAAELLYTLTGERASRAVCWLVASVYLSLVHYASVGLMETPLALVAALLGLLLYARGHSAAFLVLGAAPFLRVELGALVVALLAHQAVCRPFRWSRVLLWLPAGALPFLAYQLYFFGSVVPHTATAKRLVYVLSYGDSLGFLLGLAFPGYPLVALGWGRLILPGLLLTAMLVALVCGSRSGGSPPGARPLALLALGCGCATAAAYVGARGLVFPWYVPLVTVPSALGIAALALWSRSRVVAALLLVGLALPCGIDLASSLSAALGDPAGYRFFADNARVRRYLEVGARLYERYPDARLLSSEIGGLGHTFRGELLDGVGLITPAALAHHPMAVPDERSAGFLGAIPVGYVREVRPELIVSMDIFIEDFLRSPERAAYLWTREPFYVDEDLARARSSVLWGSRYLNVFVRRDLADDRAPK